MQVCPHFAEIKEKGEMAKRAGRTGMKIRPLITRGEKRRREKRLPDLKDEEEEQRGVRLLTVCTRVQLKQGRNLIHLFCSKVIRKIFHKIIVLSFATRRNWI